MMNSKFFQDGVGGRKERDGKGRGGEEKDGKGGGKRRTEKG